MTLVSHQVHMCAVLGVFFSLNSDRIENDIFIEKKNTETSQQCMSLTDQQYVLPAM